jgi:perosamine synthetase
MPRAAAASERSSEAWRRSVCETFEFLKRCNAMDQLYGRALPLGATLGWLLPIGDLHLADDELVASIARWREQSMDTSPTRFTVSVDGTRNWLSDQVVGRADRLLFLVADAHGRRVGHLGVTLGMQDGRELEYGYLLRGEHIAPGLMRLAQAELLRWSFEELIADAVFCLTLSDNARGLEFVMGAPGAHRIGAVPLRRHHDADRVELLPLEPGDIAPPDAQYTVIGFSRQGPEPEATPIDIAGPSITGREAAYALDAARHGWGLARSGYLERLADEFASYVDAGYALPTSSCTGAMHLALLAQGLGPGDEVIVPDLTWVATAGCGSVRSHSGVRRCG